MRELTGARGQCVMFIEGKLYQLGGTSGRSIVVVAAPPLPSFLPSTPFLLFPPLPSLFCLIPSCESENCDACWHNARQTQPAPQIQFAEQFRTSGL